MFQILAELSAQVVAPQGKLDRGLQESKFIAGVVARAFETVSINRTVTKQMLERIGELDFAAAAGFDGFDGLENFRR